MSDLETFRAETRAWLEANCPQSMRNVPRISANTCWGGRKWVFTSDDQRIWMERMVEKGWTVPEWPKEYGGGGLSKDEAKILGQEMARIQAHPALMSIGIMMLGPALLHFGTEEQKKEHLPKIARGEIRWAQGYSEPGAGSDLASVSTRCEDKGDHWLVNGSKIWTTFGHKADKIFALVRTDPEAPKHKGISFLLIDMETPGVSARPIKLISGLDHFSATFFDDVKVPKENLVYEVNKGWDVAKYLLGHEREAIGSMQGALPGEKLSDRARRVLGAEGLAALPTLRSDIIAQEIDNMTMSIAVERLRDMAKARNVPGTFPSILKLAGTEIDRRRTEVVMAIEGYDALAADSREAYDWLQTPPNLLGGGSSEIQLNVIAKRGLELPSE